MPQDPSIGPRVAEWLSTHCAAMVCPCCGGGNWGIGGVVTMLPLERESVFLGGSAIPAVPVVCLTCGYMRLFSAVTMGLLPAKPAGEPSSGGTTS
jgi:hypothetical protein